MSIRDVARAIVAPGKGILAADESSGTIKKRFDAIGCESTRNRAGTYREMPLIGDGTVPEKDRDDVMRALFDCPVHAIVYMGEHRPSDVGAVHHEAQESPEPDPKTDDSKAISGFVR